MHALPRRPASCAATRILHRGARTLAALLWLLAVVFAGLAVLPAAAAPVPWQESDDIQLVLGMENFAPPVGTTVTLSFQNSVLSNQSSQARYAGLYFGWMWVRQQYWDPASPEIPLPWSNATQSYAGSDAGPWGAQVAVSVSAATAAGPLPAQTLLLGSLPAPSSTGTPWTPSPPDTAPITALDSWEVPLLELGLLAGGGDIVFDLVFTLDFSAVAPGSGLDAEALAQDWYVNGGYSFWAQGLQAVPEPGSLALVGCALGAAAFVLRRRRIRAA